MRDQSVLLGREGCLVILRIFIYVLVNLASWRVIVIGEWRYRAGRPFRENELSAFRSCLRGYGLMKGANGEEGFKDSAAGIVLVENLTWRTRTRIQVSYKKRTLPV